MDIWREVRTSDLYDAPLIAARVAHLKTLLHSGDIPKIAFAVRAGEASPHAVGRSVAPAVAPLTRPLAASRTAA